MSIDLGRRLMIAGVISAEDVEAALFESVAGGVSFLRALLDRGAATERAVDAELARRGGLALRNVVVQDELFALLPKGLCARISAVPTRLDKRTGVVDIAAADPLDPHVPREMGFHLGAPIRVLRAHLSTIEAALQRVAPDARDRGPSRRETPPFPHGAPQTTLPPPPSMELPLVVKRAPPSEAIEAEPRSARRDTLRIGTPARPGVDRGSDITGARRATPRPEQNADPSEGAGAPATPPAAARIAHASPAEPSRPPMLPPPPPADDAASPRSVTDSIRGAVGRDEVVAYALRGLGAIAARAAIFAVRRDGFHGWACNAPFGDQAALREVVVPQGEPSLFATTVAAGYYLGPLPSTAPHRELIAVMGTASADVASVVVRAAGRAVLILLGDDLEDTMRGTRQMEAIARACGEALTRLLASRA